MAERGALMPPARLKSLGVSPRLLLLYVGDLLLTLKDTTWVFLSMGGGVYGPRFIPCFWLAGLFYLTCVLAAIRHVRDSRTSFLLVVFSGVALVVTVVPSSDRWHNFWYAGGSLIPAIVLASRQADLLLRYRWGRFAVSLLLLALSVWMIVFVSGPKWGYFCPDPEKALLGRIFYITTSRGWEQKELNEKQTDEIHRRISDFLAGHPRSVFGQYLRLLYATDDAERSDALAKGRAIDPFNPAIALYEADMQRRKGDLAGGVKRLREVLAKGRDHYLLCRELGMLEYEMGDYTEAEKHVLQSLSQCPSEADTCKALYLIYDAKGEKEKGPRSIAQMASIGPTPSRRRCCTT